MCFSEEASFTAAVVIATIAGAAIQKSQFSRLLWLALSPLFFAWQQFGEGLIWLHLKQILEKNSFVVFFQYYYLFFAYVGWPIWISFSLLMAEKIPSRRTILGALLVAGFLLGLYNARAILISPVEVTAVKNSIRYGVNISYDELWFYSIVTLLPWFVSSLKGSAITGLAFLLSFFVAGYFYEYTFASVWCFFGALISIMIYGIIRANIRQFA